MSKYITFTIEYMNDRILKSVKRLSGKKFTKKQLKKILLKGTDLNKKYTNIRNDDEMDPIERRIELQYNYMVSHPGAESTPYD